MALPLTHERRPRTPAKPRLARQSDRKMPNIQALQLCSKAFRPFPNHFDLFNSKRRASFLGCLTPPWLRYCMAAWAGADPDDVDDVSSLSEPHGPDGAMADRGCARAEISQSGSARRVRQTVQPARRSPRTDLTHLPHLHPPRLRHRQGAGGQSGTRGDRGDRLRDAVRLIAAFQEGELAGAAAPAAGGADVGSLRDPAARHR